MIEDAHRDLWIGKTEGSRAGTGIPTAPPSFGTAITNPQSLASDAVARLVLDARGRVWIGTSDAGSTFSSATGRIEQPAARCQHPDTLISDRILTLTFDRRTLWAGTTGADRLSRVAPRVSDSPPLPLRLQPQQRAFTHIPPRKAIPALWSGNEVQGSYEVREALCGWARSCGLNRLDRNGRVVESFRHNPQIDSLADDDVRAVLEDPSGVSLDRDCDGLDAVGPRFGPVHHHRHGTADRNHCATRSHVPLQPMPRLMWDRHACGRSQRWNPAVGTRRYRPSGCEQAGHRICRRSRQKGLGWNSAAVYSCSIRIPARRCRWTP